MNRAGPAKGGGQKGLTAVFSTTDLAAASRHRGPAYIATLVDVVQIAVFPRDASGRDQFGAATSSFSTTGHRCSPDVAVLAQVIEVPGLLAYSG